MAASSSVQHPTPDRAKLLAILLVGYAAASASTWLLTRWQAPGADFSCFWAGARAALAEPARLYDFEFITRLQGWPLGPGKLRPYIYPPSALFAFLPFALPAFWWAYGLFVAATGAGLAWAAAKARAPWWFLLLPPVAYVAYCGQVTFLVAALAIGGLAMRNRPGVAGLLLGMSAAIKPQLLLLAPIALVADRQWRTMLTAGVTGLALIAASVFVWGWRAWLEWLAALKRFNEVVYHGDLSLVQDAVTPYAALKAHGFDPNAAFLLAPVAAFVVWLVFRRTRDPIDRSIALFGGALAITPYAMNYEAALFAPAVAAYLARTGDPRWPGYAGLSAIYITSLGPFPLGCVLAAILLPIVRIAPPLRTSWAALTAQRDHATSRASEHGTKNQH